MYRPTAGIDVMDGRIKNENENEIQLMDLVLPSCIVDLVAFKLMENYFSAQERKKMKFSFGLNLQVQLKRGQ